MCFQPYTDLSEKLLTAIATKTRVTNINKLMPISINIDWLQQACNKHCFDLSIEMLSVIF